MLHASEAPEYIVVLTHPPPREDGAVRGWGSCGVARLYLVLYIQPKVQAPHRPWLRRLRIRSTSLPTPLRIRLSSVRGSRLNCVVWPLQFYGQGMARRGILFMGSCGCERLARGGGVSVILHFLCFPWKCRFGGRDRRLGCCCYGCMYVRSMF